MRRRLALLVLSLATSLVPLAARAQSVDPLAPAPGSGTPGPGISDRAALLGLAGPRAIVRDAEDGTIRLLYGAHVQPWSGDPARDALALVGRFGQALGVPQGADLRVERAQTWHGFTIVRLRRYADGRPVIGATMVVRFLADGAIDLVASDPGPARVEHASPGIDEERAVAIARGLSLGLEIVRTAAPAPVALVVADAILPVWQIDVHGAALSQRHRVLLDARDGRELAAFPLALDARGRVFATNPTTDMGTPIDVDLADLTSAERLTGTAVRVLDCNAGTGGCAPIQRAVADVDGNFLYDPDPTRFDDEFAEVNAYHHLTRAAAWHLATNGFTWTCGTSQVMRAYVNYTEAAGAIYENAAFTPASGGDCGFLLFGQGSGHDFAYDADVVYHEYGHAVTDQIAAMTGFISDNLGVSYEPLAVNEGTSDYYAGSIQGNPEIAESFAGLGVGVGGAETSLRIIANTDACPGSLFGEGHQDGRLWGGLGWDVHEALGAGVADVLVFTTIASMTEDPSLASAGELMIATAMGMQTMGTLGADEVATITSLAETRGLPECQRVIPLDDGMQRMGWSGNEYITGAVGQSIAPVHYRIDVPADATSLQLHVRRMTFTGRYSLHLAVDRPVRVNAVRTYAQSVIPVEVADVTIDADSALPLPRCHTLYVAIQSTDLRSAGQNVYGITATLERSGDPAAECPVEMPDAGPVTGDAGVEVDGGTATAGGGGCGCRVGGGENERGAALAALAVIGLLAARRRR